MDKSSDAAQNVHFMNTLLSSIFITNYGHFFMQIK